MAEIRYLKVKELAQRLGVSRSTIWEWSRTGKLPKPVKLGDAVTRWRSDEVEAALEKLEKRAA